MRSASRSAIGIFYWCTPLLALQATGPFERIESAWIGQQFNQPLAPSQASSIAVAIAPRPGLIQAGHLQGQGCRAGLLPAPSGDAEAGRQFASGHGRASLVLAPLLQFLAAGMEFTQAAAGAQGLATIAQVLANGAADVGHRKTAEGSAAAWIKGLKGLD